MNPLDRQKIIKSVKLKDFKRNYKIKKQLMLQLVDVGSRTMI